MLTRALAVALALALLAAGAQTWRLHALQRDVARAELERAEAAREAERLARRSMETIADETDRTLARARADAAAARSAADGLRVAAASAGAACRDAGPAAPGAPASAAGLVLADVLGRAAERAAELAAAADAAHAAGSACERAYGAVTWR